MDETIIYHEHGKDPLYKTWHASNEHLFIYIYSGTGSIVSGEKIFPIKEKSLVFISANTYHYTLPDIPELYDRSKLIITNQKFLKIVALLQEVTTSCIFDNTIVYAEISESDSATVEHIFTEFQKYVNVEGNEKILLSSLLRLMFFFDKYALDSTSTVTGVMNRAVKFINENIAQNIDIDTICSAINISKYHFCRQFKVHTGMTVMKYVLKTRIVLAKSDLWKTSLSITEISEKYGFSSISYFCRVFKEEEHCSPFQYRKKSFD